MIEETYKTIDVIIKSFKKARRNNDYLTILTNALALLEYLPEMIEYMVGQEAEYRKFEAGLADKTENEKRLPSSYCETQAKATNFYKEWQRAKNFIELCYELVNIAKKLASSVDKEFNAQ
jgi:hypothetical protein